jgi:hypothetical protein
LNEQHYDIYFGAIPRDPKAGHKLPQPLLLTCLWADIDVGPGKQNERLIEVLTRIRAFKPRPSLIVKSGHGVHIYFLLKKPTRIEAIKAKTLLRALAKALRADLQSAEPARVLRLPGTVNWRNEKKPSECRVLALSRKRRYRLSKLKQLFGIQAGDGVHLEQSGTEDYFEFFSKHVKDLRATGEMQAMGLCPFHDDHRPSWSLRVTDGVWHCFGCGRSGSALSFCLMRGIETNLCPKVARLQEHNALAIENGGYFMWKRRAGKWEKRRITDFILDWGEENRVSDKIRLEDRVFKGNLVTAEGEQIPIRLSNDELCSNPQFYEALILAAGTKISLSEHDAGNIRRASFLLSSPRQIVTCMDFGFQDDSRFVTQSLLVTVDGVNPATEGIVDLKGIEHARFLDLKRLSSEEVAYLLKHIRDDLLELHPHRITYTLLAFLGAAPLMHFMEDTTRYALWLVGLSGTGKSFIAKLIQCFYGDFMAEGRPVSWASTPNSLQFMGYYFKDCVYLIDDYKPVMIHNPGEVIRFLQNYADFYARSRLTSEIQSRKDYYVRGLLLTTGEDLPAGHASVIARSLIVNVPKRPLDTKRGGRCLARCKDYPGVTASYIHFLLRLPNLRKRVNALVRKYLARFLEGIKREDNSARIARNLGACRR